MNESLARFGTVVFDYKVMRSMLFANQRSILHPGGRIEAVPDHGALDLAQWLAMVPTVYREEVVAIAERITADHVGRPLTKDRIDTVAADILSVVWRDVQPRDINGNPVYEPFF